MEATLVLAFTAGMVASVNPCAFSLLPAYIGAFVTGDDVSEAVEVRILRAVGVASAVSVGFVAVFGVAGLLLGSVSGQVRRQIPWVTIAIGGVLVVAGLAVMAGWKPRLFGGGVVLGGSRSRFVSMVGFGVSYAVASLSCTIGPFLAVTGAAISLSTVGGIASYVAYALGMGVVILAVSVAAALARTSLVATLRGVSRFAPLAGGFLMILTGLYAIWYGRWALAVYGGDLETDPLIDVGETLRVQVLVAVESFGAIRLAALIVLVVVFAVIGFAAFGRRPGQPDSVQPNDSERLVDGSGKHTVTSSCDDPSTDQQPEIHA